MRLPRCDRHTESAELPKLCHTCQRIAVEHDIVTRTVDLFITAGWKLKEDQEDEWMDRESLLDLLFNLDMATLICHPPAGKNGWVMFVFGNDGWDVISDYTMNLEDILQPITDYCQTLEP